MLDPCFMRELYVVEIELYSYNRTKYTHHRVRDVNYWLLGRGSLYSYPMLAKTRANLQLVIL